MVILALYLTISYLACDKRNDFKQTHWGSLYFVMLGRITLLDPTEACCRRKTHNTFKFQTGTMFSDFFLKRPEALEMLLY